MQKRTAKKLSIAASFLMMNVFLVSCSKDGLDKKPVRTTTSTTTTTTTTTTSPTPTPTTSGTTSGTSTTSGTQVFNVGYNNWLDGAYTLTQATTDFKSVLGWADTRMSISGGRMKTTLLANTVGPNGGLVSWIDVADHSAYQLSFDMMFDSNFDFSAGGKVGFGFLLGEGYTGGVPGTDGNGGSARIMWYKNWDGTVVLKPYLYYKDQPGQYGNDFAKKYPATGSVSKGVWHNVKMYVKSNTGSNTDGRIQIVINGTTVMDQAIRWTTNDLKRLVNRVCFETFRGGADATWQSTTNGYIYFDNVNLTGM